ncbi:MAG: hypothetical protein EOO12_06225 [Chitinophagaceae bacterium]|nr:MAG: hypothetical protein EOO12_06225 [Chitinophagaceae bacterium]
MAKHTQPWIGSAAVDSAFILAPPFLALAALFLFPTFFSGNGAVSDAGWVLLVLLVDVAHVYSTLYRTYFDPAARARHGGLLWGIPALCYVAGVLAYSSSPAFFWRVLAYAAVFHFVRQQYGFLRIYSRREPREGLFARIDRWTIYGVTLYPLLWWHLGGKRHFDWFVDGDFLYLNQPRLLPWITALYIVLLLVYIVSEIIRSWRARSVNAARLLLVAGTAGSWYFGIVYFNGDLAFTLTNVISHGVPYMALVWIYGRKEYVRQGRGTRLLRYLFSLRGLALFLGVLFLFAWLEEGLWDVVLWKEHARVFGTVRWQLDLSKPLIALIVPLLALPQLTHYVLDGFIWKIRPEGFAWKGSTALTRTENSLSS